MDWGEVSREHYAELFAKAVQGDKEAHQTLRFVYPKPRIWERKWWTKRFWRLFGVWKRGELPGFGRCACGRVRVLYFTHPMTQYPEEPGKPDPNRVGRMCRDCQREYEEHWQERWDDYHSGLL